MTETEGRRHRIGRFRLDLNLTDAQGITESLFNRLEFVPYKVDHVYSYNTVEFIGRSPLFDKELYGFTAPEYDLNIEIGHDDGGNAYVKKLTAVRLDGPPRTP